MKSAEAGGLECLDPAADQQLGGRCKSRPWVPPNRKSDFVGFGGGGSWVARAAPGGGSSTLAEAVSR